MEIALAISITSIVITVVNFALNRKDKARNDTKEDSYKWGQVEEKLSNIEKTLAKIVNKLDSFDKEVDEKIEKAIDNHVAMYHKRKKEQ